MIIKVDLDGDVRRISVALSEDATAIEKFQEIRAAVAQGFDMEETLLPVLKYRDEEGDICTLVEASVEDLLELSNSGTMRLLASTTPVPLPKEDAAHKMSGLPAAEVQSDEMASSTRDATNDTDATIAGSAQEEAATDDKAVSNTSDGHMEADSAPHSDAAGCPSEGSSPVPSSEAQGVAELTAMGFSEEQAVFAIECAQGSVEGAVEYLVHGTQQQHQQGPPGYPAASSAPSVQANGSDSGAHGVPAETSNGPASFAQEASQQQSVKNATKIDYAQVFLSKSISALRSGLTRTASPSRAFGSECATADTSTSARTTSSAEKIERKMRSLPGNVIEQLQKVRGQMHQIVANVKQHKGQELMHSSQSEQFQNLQATLKAMQASLGEFGELVQFQAGLKTATGAPLEAEEEERLLKVEAEIADAHHFLTETLSTLHTHASEALKNNEAAAKDAAVVAMETMDVVVAAAMDAALAAMATVDDILFVDVQNSNAARTATSDGYTQPATAATEDAFLLAPEVDDDKAA